MAKRWQKVTVEQARQHPLYGVGGWLIVFAVGLLLGLISGLGDVRGEAHKAGMTMWELLSLDHPAATYVNAALGLQVFIVASIYWLLLSKHASFRMVTSALLLGGWPAAALLGALGPFPGLAGSLALAFFSWAISCAVWVTYLQRSERVRVTFENCLAADAPRLAKEEQQRQTVFAERAKLGGECPRCGRVISLSDVWCPHCRASFLAKEEQQRQTVFAERAKLGGECPRCGRVISLSDVWCPHCRASFGPGSRYRLIPPRVVQPAESQVSPPVPRTSIPMTSTPSAAQPVVKSAQPALSPLAHSTSAVDDEDLWAAAISEFDGDNRRVGLWAKAFAECNGDEAPAKAAYLRERVRQLAAEASVRKDAEVARQASE